MVTDLILSETSSIIWLFFVFTFLLMLIIIDGIIFNWDFILVILVANMYCNLEFRYFGYCDVCSKYKLEV